MVVDAWQLVKSEKSPTARIFVAVPLPEALCRELSALESRFVLGRPFLRWVRADLMHVTVRFLGSTVLDRVPLVTEATERAVKRAQPHTLHLADLGGFPNAESPRILWVGLQRDAGYRDLAVLFERLNVELTHHGFLEEKHAFTPHITLARVRDDARGNDRRVIGEELATERAFLPDHSDVPVRELIVMRSDLSPSGPTYTPIASATLGS
ncbi:MAG: RNA 2',3'-cyclic phosphodiesterase [Chloroflexota bacterium]|nr:MAG: RNA 2',3'-cyclic phosphodiesterase [Chloroflexota bacterium]